MQTTQKLDEYITEFSSNKVSAEQPITSSAELTQVIEMAQELNEMLTEDYPQHDWMKAKVTKAANYIKAVHEYISNDLNEEGQPDSTDPVKVYISTN